MGIVRFKIHQADYQVSVVARENAMGEHEFDAAWTEGAALSTEEAIAYAQRGRGERKRPNSGWESLTPAEHEVVRLGVRRTPQQGHRRATLRFTRTVQAHLAHVYTKLGLTSRVQLVQEAANMPDCGRPNTYASPRARYRQFC